MKNLDLELRHVNPSKLNKISTIIDKDRGWEKILEKLASVHNSCFHRDAIDIIKQQASCGRSSTLALLNHWSISGRRRPTIKTFLDCLQSCELRWAEEYVWESILGYKPIADKPPLIAIANIDSNSVQSHYNINEEFRFTILDELIDGTEVEYLFNLIYESSNQFTNEPYEPKKQSGSKIGEGRFSSVFRAQTRLKLEPKDPLQTVAAKLLKAKCNENYLANEIKLIRKVRHENILELLGVALGESSPGCLSYICLIYPFMENGSLLDCLTSGLPSSELSFINWKKRIGIAVKIAKGIAYLHSFEDGPIVHRDVKTANIFIDLKLEPKLGDFTLVRQMDTSRDTGTLYSQNIIGTSVYMPPEAFRGDISIKFDTFSFGVVLLELLTGLRPFIEELEEDLITYINDQLSDIDDELVAGQREFDEGRSETRPTNSQEKKTIFLTGLLDKKAGDWNVENAKMMFEIALQAIESRKKIRPRLCSLLPSLELILSRSS